jgi:cell division protein FtsW
MQSSTIFKKSAKKRNTSSNRLLLISVLFTLLISLFLVYNASSTYAYNYFGNSYYFLVNQFVWVVFSLFIFYILQLVPFELVSKFAILFYFVSIFFLFIVLLPTPFSLEVYGARRWLILNPDPFPALPFINRLSFQPSEMAKLALCLAVPAIYLKMLKKDSFHALLKGSFYFLVPALLVLLEPNLKDSLILVFMGSSIIFSAGASIKYFIYAIPVAFLLLLLLIFTSSYRMERVKTYLGKGDTKETSYHARQLNIALGSGGIFGVGIGQSRQKNEYLPEVVGDSIFAIFGEEFGFVGSTFLLSLISLVFYAIFRSIHKMDNLYERLLGVGVLSWFGIQSFLNMGSISGLIPLTGVPLPLISYGGSSLLFMVSALAFVYKFSKG